MQELSQMPATLVLFESARRIERLLAEMSEIFGSDRQAAICRELTKKFEEVLRGSLAELSGRVEDAPPRGEIVVVVGRVAKTVRADDLSDALMTALKTMSIKEAAAVVSTALGLPKRQVYQAALEMSKSGRD